MNRKGDLFPISMMFAIGVLLLTFVLLYIYSDFENSDQENTIHALTGDVGAGTLLSDLLAFETNGENVQDLLIKNPDRAKVIILRYFKETESIFFYYELYRNEELLVESEKTPYEKSEIVEVLRGNGMEVEIKLVYEK